MSEHRHRLGMVLCAAEVINDDELDRAIYEQRNTRPWRPLGDILIDLYPRRVSPEAVEDALRHQRAQRSKRLTDVIDDARGLAQRTQQLALAIIGRDKPGA